MNINCFSQYFKDAIHAENHKIKNIQKIKI